MNNVLRSLSIVVACLVIVALFLLGLIIATPKQPKYCHVYEKDLQLITSYMGNDTCYNTHTEQYQRCYPIEVECK